jgi:hypothetical protein
LLFVLVLWWFEIFNWWSWKQYMIRFGFLQYNQNWWNNYIWDVFKHDCLETKRSWWKRFIFSVNLNQQDEILVINLQSNSGDLILINQFNHQTHWRVENSKAIFIWCLSRERRKSCLFEEVRSQRKKLLWRELNV